MRKYKYILYNSHTGRQTSVKSINLNAALVLGKKLIGTRKGIVRAYRLKK